MTCDAPSWARPRAAYVHLPFCAHRCGYCDFAIAVGRDDRRAAYLDALEAELRRLGAAQPVDTLFLGGGTPTYLDVSELERLLDALAVWFPLRPGHEFSVEANPGTLGADKLRLLVERGLTRISLGCQSFDPALLRALDRDHAPADAFRAVDAVRAFDLTLSIDLIFGVPGQTLDGWRSDLAQALALAPDGVATYGLTYEKGTPLWKAVRAGQTRTLDEETERAFYAEAMDRLEGAGVGQYELSNFARPGNECRHNRVYWANDAHWGFGMGAAEYVDGERRVNTRDLDGYVKKALAGRDVAFQRERLVGSETALETLGQNLRRREGVVRTEFSARFGEAPEAYCGAALERLVGWGLLADDGASLRLTRDGKFVADSVVAECWTASRR